MNKYQKRQIKIDEEYKDVPEGVKNFIDKFLDLFNLNEFYEDFRKKGGALNGYSMWIALVNKLINTEIIYDKDKVSDEYKNVKYVKDLPENDIKLCLKYLNFILGLTYHTGGIDFYMLYEKHLKV